LASVGSAIPELLNFRTASCFSRIKKEGVDKRYTLKKIIVYKLTSEGVE
jgi:hypothetical protein